MLFWTKSVYGKRFYFHLLNLLQCEVSPAWSRYELPKLGIAGSNPALRIFIILICGQKFNQKVNLVVQRACGG